MFHIHFFLCRDLFKDVLRCGVASAAGAVRRQHHTGCADSRTTRRVLEDAAGRSSTESESGNIVSFEKLNADGR